MAGSNITTNPVKYKLYTVFINMRTGVAYDEQDPIDKSRAEIVTTLNVFHINNRQKEYGQVIFRDSAHVTSWAKRILNQRR